MNAHIIDNTETAGGQYFTIDVEGQVTMVGVYKDGRVSVCVNNACHAVRRGTGKIHGSASAAIAAYSGDKTRTAIALAVDVAADFTLVREMASQI